MVWSWLIVAYLFLGGLSAGTFIACAFLQLAHGDRYLAEARRGVALALVFLFLGALCLLLDIPQPLRAMKLAVSFSNVASSWMARGVWIILGCVAMFGCWFVVAGIPHGGRAVIQLSVRRRSFILNVIGGIGTVLALLLAFYTGELLKSASGVPAWDTGVVPALFMMSALDTGLALVRLLLARGYCPRHLRSTYHFIDFILLVLVTIELVLALVYGAGWVADAKLQAILPLVLQNPRVWLWVISFFVLIAATLAMGVIRLMGVCHGGAVFVLEMGCCLLAGVALRSAIVQLGAHVSQTGFFIPGLG